MVLRSSALQCAMVTFSARCSAGGPDSSSARPKPRRWGHRDDPLYRSRRLLTEGARTALNDAGAKNMLGGCPISRRNTVSCRSNRQTPARWRWPVMSRRSHWWHRSKLDCIASGSPSSRRHRGHRRRKDPTDSIHHRCKPPRSPRPETNPGRKGILRKTQSRAADIPLAFQNNRRHQTHRRRRVCHRVIQRTGRRQLQPAMT